MEGNKQIGGLVTRIYDNLIVGMEEIIKKSGTGGENDLFRGVKGNILMDFITEYGSISMLDKDILQYSRRIDDLNDMPLERRTTTILSLPLWKGP